MRAKLTVCLAGALIAGAQSPVSAGPALLFEASTGNILYSEDQDNLWHPASLTKIMTSYLVFDALKSGRITLEQKIPVSQKAFIQPPSKVGLPVGAEMTVDLAIKALIVKSANDVAVMLAEAVGGSEESFVQLMNDTAKRLGMTRTTFVNPNGLPAAEQVTTARDLARLSRAVLRDFPQNAGLWSLPEVQIGKLKLATHNHLLKTFEGADGIKTGFICDSGFNVVSSATRDGRKLVAIVLGEPSGRERSIRAASLLDHGFQTQGWKQLFSSPPTLDTLPIPADAKGVQSMRQTVTGWECGARKARPVPKKKAGQAVAGAGGKDKAGKAKAAKAGKAPTETGSAPTPVKQKAANRVQPKADE